MAQGQERPLAGVLCLLLLRHLPRDIRLEDQEFKRITNYQKCIELCNLLRRDRVQPAGDVGNVEEVRGRHEGEGVERVVDGTGHEGTGGGGEGGEGEENQE